MSAAAFLRRAITGFTFVLSAGALMGQVTPQGGEHLVVGAIKGDQVWPCIAFDPAGSGAGLIGWQDSLIDGSGFGIGGALMGSAGSVISQRFQVNKAGTMSQFYPQAQILGNGRAIYVWNSRIAGTPDVYARLARPGVNAANFTTADLRVNTYTKMAQTWPVVTGLADGSAIVVWQSRNQDGSGWGVYARRILANGTFATPTEYRVTQVTDFNQRAPAITTLANGNFVIVWVSEQERFSGGVDIYGRLFSPGKGAVTDEVLINDANMLCDHPAVSALSDGGFTVVWDQVSPNGDNGKDIWGRTFSSSGYGAGASFLINTNLLGDQVSPKIASGPTGSLVVWTSIGQDGDREGVFGRFVANGSQPVGGEQQVNTSYISQQMHPAVAWNGVDRFVVLWAGFNGTTGFDLFGRNYALSSQ